MTTAYRPHRGSCLCGAVAFAIDGPLKPITICHCGKCRRQTGLAYASTAAWTEHLSFQADSGLKWYRSSDTSRRGFCGECGAALFFEDIGDDRIYILVGALDDPAGLEIAAHIHVDGKPGWYDFADAAPRLPQGGAAVPMPPKDG